MEGRLLKRLVHALSLYSPESDRANLCGVPEVSRPLEASSWDPTPSTLEEGLGVKNYHSPWPIGRGIAPFWQILNRGGPGGAIDDQRI